MYDLVIRNGKIVSGRGNPWYWGDVAIVGNRIVKVGRLASSQARRVIDAGGCVVSPGFIDGHSHSDLYLFKDPTAEAKIMQGVTTENVGMDGLSVAPVDQKGVSDWSKHLAGLAGDLKRGWKWGSFAEYLNRIDELAPSIHVSSYVGLGTIRFKVMGMSERQASGEEIEQMKGIAAQAMEEGARGISSGLIYSPNQCQTIQEMVEIAKVVRGYDGIYDVHMRSESDKLIEAMEEVIEIGRRAEIPVLITHFKVGGKKNWGSSEKALALLDDARSQGVDVTIAQYPYVAGSTMLHAIIPPWYHSKGPDRLVQMLLEEKEPIKKDIRGRRDWENFVASNGWENIFVSSVASDENRKYEGRNVVEIASMRGLSDPADAALDILAEEELAVGMIVFYGHEKDVVRIMKHPSVSFITDGILGGKPHPRVYGSFPRIIGKYVREEGVLSMEEAARKMTSLPAEKLRLKTKGVIAENYDADITIFDPDRIMDHATYEDPVQFSSGIEYVIVNGVVVVERGKHTGARPGKSVRGL